MFTPTERDFSLLPPSVLCRRLETHLSIRRDYSITRSSFSTINKTAVPGLSNSPASLDENMRVCLRASTSRILEKHMRWRMGYKMNGPFLLLLPRCCCTAQTPTVNPTLFPSLQSIYCRAALQVWGHTYYLELDSYIRFGVNNSNSSAVQTVRTAELSREVDLCCTIKATSLVQSRDVSPVQRFTPCSV